MANSRFYSSTAAVTNLQVTANPSDISIQVASSSGWPGTFPFILSLDYGAANEELVLATSGGPTTFNVTRAYDGTSASTHNAGAVVRHVSSAIDFTDSRTHEASSSAHGISGSFVDTVSSQTVANKTLSSPVINNPTLGGTMTATSATIANGTYTGSTLTTPTINGATVTGTVAGTPTYSGLNTFSAGITTEGETVQKVNGTDTAITVKRDADAGLRMKVTADGGLGWTDGTTTTPDVSMFRASSGTLQTTGAYNVTGNINGGTVSSTGNITGSADVTWTGVPWSTYSVTWTASSGGNSIGNGTLTGRYKQFGKLTHVLIMLTFGSTTNPGSGTYSFSLPVQAANFGIDTVGVTQYLGADRWGGENVISANATTTSAYFPQLFTSGPLNGAATGKLSQNSATFPEPPGTGDKLRFSFWYEAA